MKYVEAVSANTICYDNIASRQQPGNEGKVKYAALEEDLRRCYDMGGRRRGG